MVCFFVFHALSTLLTFVHSRMTPVASCHRSKRRARLCGIYYVLLVLQLVDATMYLVPNVCGLYEDCRAGALVDWSGVSERPCEQTSAAMSCKLALLRCQPALAGSSMVLLEYIVRHETSACLEPHVSVRMARRAFEMQLCCCTQVSAAHDLGSQCKPCKRQNR